MVDSVVKEKVKRGPKRTESDIYGKKLLRSLRMEKGLTRKDFARQMGVSDCFISLLEVGDRPVSELWARRLGDFFKFDYRLFMAK